MNVKRILILLLAWFATQIALDEPSLAEKNAAENAAIKKGWESWNEPGEAGIYFSSPLSGGLAGTRARISSTRCQFTRPARSATLGCAGAAAICAESAAATT